MTDTRELVERYVMEVDSDFGDDAKAIPVADPWGQWVRASDYDALSERCRRLTAVVEEIASRQTLSGHDGDLDWLIDDARAALAGGRG